MDIISLYYFSELAKDLHITKTANRLYISQQTLSNHIQRLEEYYGVPLLYRKPYLSLTSAGECVLSFAKNVNNSSKNLQDLLAEIKQQERGVLRFGASTSRMNAILPDVLPSFSARYPNVEIRLTDAISSALEPLVINGELDFSVILSEDTSSKLIEHHLINDQVYICIEDSLLSKFYGANAEELKSKAMNGAHIKDFSKLPFGILSNRMGKQIQYCFDEARISPQIYITSTHTQINTAICFKGLAACFASHSSLYNQRHQIPHNINIFPLWYKNEPMIQTLSLIHNKDRYLSHYLSFFMDILLERFSKVERICLARKV